MTPQSYNEIAFVFGGDGMCKEAAFGAMSLASSASTIVRFTGTHGTFSPFFLNLCSICLYFKTRLLAIGRIIAVNGIGARPSFRISRGTMQPVSSHAGHTSGSQSFAQSRWDGLDWVIIINTEDLPPFTAGQNPFDDLLYTGSGSGSVTAFLAANPVV